jgi:SAM-dependent methyltransferase
LTAMLKLDLACGAHKQEGYFGIDIAEVEGADQVLDLFQFPWPFLTGSVSHIHCSHFFEHVPAKLRKAFMEEIWRVCAPGAEVVIICPRWDSVRAIQDFTHEWPPIAAESFLYFDADVRKRSGLDHMGITCDFDLSTGDHNGDLLMILKARK